MLNEDNIIIAGDTLSLDLLYEDYTPAAGWYIWIALRGNTAAIDIKSGSTGVTITTTTGRFVITATNAATAAYTAGDYKYAVYMYKGSPTVTERHLVDEGTVTIKPNISAMTSASDARSHVKKVLDAIEATIEGRASQDQMAYTIAGRSLSRMPIDDLIKFRDVYRREYQSELKAEKLAQGIGTNSRVMVRF